MVWKTVLQVTNLQEVEFPINAQLLSVQVQAGQVCVWFKFDDSAKKEYRTIEMVGTGHKLLKEGFYIGTVLLHGGSLVVHVFDAGRISR